MRLVTSDVKLIDSESKKVETNAGSYRYDWLISTMSCRIAPSDGAGYGLTDPRTLKSRKADFIYFLGDKTNVATSQGICRMFPCCPLT